MTSSTAAAVAEPSKLKLSIKALGRDGIASILHLAQIRRQLERVDTALEFDGAHAGAGAGTGAVLLTKERVADQKIARAHACTPPYNMHKEQNCRRV